jgi:ubiquitin-conjugating enzyme E2 J2
MVSQICKNRLLKELRKMQTAPPENICAVPLESNILEWHYVIRGVAGPYKGGFYWGKL